MRAARMQEGNAVMDSKVYRRPTDSVTEARYLVAVLNAPALEEAFRVCRTSGRDFHKKSVGDQCRFQPGMLAIACISNSRHWHAHAERTVRTMDLPVGQVSASRRIREQLVADGTMAEIDVLVREILPNHVT